MTRTLLLLLCLFAMFTLSAKEDSVIACCDSVPVSYDSVSVNCDSVSVNCDSVSVSCDSVPVQKKRSWIKRAYDFADRVLSPERDTNYVDTQQQYNWCAEVQLSSKFETFEMDAGRDFQLKVSPKLRTRIGPFFGWRFAFLGYNIDLRSIFSDKDKDLSASIYSAAFGLDLFYRRVGGNYNIRSLMIDGHDYSKMLNGQAFDGIKLGMTRVSFYYVMNYKYFSHQAAYSQANRQLRSAGSTIVGMSYAHNRAEMDWSKFTSLISEVSNANYSSNTLYGKQNNDEFSLTGGYAYNWVFARNWLLGSELTGSLGYLLHHTKTQKREEPTDDDFIKRIEDFSNKNIAFNGTLRLVLLYNNGPWFFGTQGYIFYYQYGNGVMMTRNVLGNIYLYAGFNF